MSELRDKRSHFRHRNGAPPCRNQPRGGPPMWDHRPDLSDWPIARGGPVPRRSLSVVVPHYGSPAPALALLRMLRAQEGDLDLQVIVVDDCSPEPFPERPGLHVVRRAVNGGFGSAVNAGAEQ